MAALLSYWVRMAATIGVELTDVSLAILALTSDWCDVMPSIPKVDECRVCDYAVDDDNELHQSPSYSTD